ncbi:hypothetical protein Tco_0876003 [Tanacetum coccineum]|uniref:Uncharacterized protein n=1 Tax=Tanacetum coccineum TaxID=301880 RepID=A0ABQ5BTU9_9ASTR
MKLDQFAQFRFNSLTKEEGWNRIEEYVQYQDDMWDDLLPSMNVSSISKAMQPTFMGRLKRAATKSPTSKHLLERLGEDGPEWVVRSKFEDELANFMLENKSHMKGIGEMLDQHHKEMHEKFSKILSAIGKSETLKPEAPTFSITTRLEVSTRDPPFPTPSKLTHANHIEGATEKEGPDGAEPNIIHNEEPAPRPSIFYQPLKSSNLPFPSRLKKKKKDDKDERLLLIFKQIQINLPFLEAMIHMPKGAIILNDILSHKEKLEKAASSVKLSEECLAIIQIRTSINLMPHSLFRRLRISKLKPSGMILEMDEDELVSIILGRPFLATARVVIDVHEGMLSLRVGSETINFNIGTSMKSKHSRDDYLYSADHTVKLVQEQWVNTVNHDEKWAEVEEEEDSNEVQVVSFYPRTEPVEPLEWKASENRLKPSSIEPPKLELKELPEHLEYAFLQENNQLPVVISPHYLPSRKPGFVTPRQGRNARRNIIDIITTQWRL